ncbi:MAG: YdcF family protein [Clostridia bacterium]|nr:YdcF family protein [Clostridia bacterium]
MVLGIQLVLIAVIFAIYGIMVKRIKSGTHFYRVWFIMGGMLLIIGILRILGLWQKLPGYFRYTVLALWLIYMAFCFIVFMKVIRSFSHKVPDDLDYIIVLGTQIREDGPSKALYFRLKRAKEYLDENPRTKVIVSGGQGYNEPVTEASGMKKWLTENGIDVSRIILEDRSKTTHENLLFSKELFDHENCSYGILSSNFHLYRASLLARKLGLSGFSLIPAYTTPLYLPHNMLREVFAFIVGRFKGHF